MEQQQLEKMPTMVGFDVPSTITPKPQMPQSSDELGESSLTKKLLGVAFASRLLRRSQDGHEARRPKAQECEINLGNTHFGLRWKLCEGNGPPALGT